MKIEVNEKPAAAKIEYPCLMATEQGAIVLFTDYGCGTVIKHPGWVVGTYGRKWDMLQFTPFTGSVTLSND
jgi:hypothetical protein